MTNESKFKVGDRVRIISGGRIATIKGYHQNDHWFIEGSRFGWHESELEPVVQETEPVVADMGDRKIHALTKNFKSEGLESGSSYCLSEQSLSEQGWVDRIKKELSYYLEASEVSHISNFFQSELDRLVGEMENRIRRERGNIYGRVGNHFADGKPMTLSSIAQFVQEIYFDDIIKLIRKSK